MRARIPLPWKTPPTPPAPSPPRKTRSSRRTSGLGLGLERLIAVKRAAGRPHDLEAVAELEALLEERERSGRD
jgi:hypothetical protein